MSSEVKATHVDVRELFSLLESSELHIVSEIHELIQINLASTKEPWLLQSLVDYYYMSHSDRAKEILANVREPHDKHLLDKLNDGMKNSEFRLPTLQLLLYIVCNQSVWIHRIINLPLFSAIIKCLKNDMDIPVLMTAVMVIICLLPILPVSIVPSLGDLFEIFHRLVTFNVKKPGSAADISLLHLQVSVYALFHRLYGMFPCHFTSFLRQQFNKKDIRSTYETAVKPMLERVRFHSLLVTGNREAEVSPNRWREMEVQDVVVECAKMSLDLIEGTWEETHCPVFGKFISVGESLGATSTPNKKDASIISPVLSGCRIVNSPMHDSSLLWSPSTVCGMSTPPLLQRATPVVSSLDVSQMSHFNFTGETPPTENSPRTMSPSYATDEAAGKTLNRNSSKSSLLRSMDAKRVSFGAGSSRASGALTPSAVQPTNVPPPSPMRPEFTSDSPAGTPKYFMAGRELQFNQTPDDYYEQISITKCRKERNPSGDSDDSFPGTSIERGGSSVPFGSVPSNILQSSAEKLPNAMNESGSLESDATDREVCDINTEHLTSIPPNMMLTAECVAQFMKKVNRIRFNSLTVKSAGNQVASSQESLSFLPRSKSCPQLQDSTRPTEHDNLVRCKSMLAHPSFQPLDGNLIEEDDDDDVDPKHKDDLHIGLKSNSKLAVSDASSVTVTADISCTVQTNAATASSQPIKDEAHCIQRYANLGALLPFALPPTAVTQCQNCQSIALDPKTYKTMEPNIGQPNIPMFSTFSPPELLDRHLQLGSEMHAKELSSIPMTTQTNWTHFGGVPPADEVNILRGQKVLIHNQLMYERHKRELHAQRNRRLLRKITNAKALEEQTSAMADALRLQETEIKNLKISLRLLQEEKRLLTATKDSDNYAQEHQLRTCLRDNEDLKCANRELKTMLISQREEHDQLKENLQRSEAKLLNAEMDLVQLRELVQVTHKLRDKVFQLQKELLLMGELKLKYEEKLSLFRNNHSSAPERDYLVATLRSENKSTEARLHKKALMLKACKSHLAETEEKLKLKENALVELRTCLEDGRMCHEEELCAVECKYQAMMRVNHALSSDMVQLYGENDRLSWKLNSLQKKIAAKERLNSSGESKKETTPERDAQEIHADGNLVSKMDGSSLDNPTSANAVSETLQSASIVDVNKLKDSASVSVLTDNKSAEGCSANWEISDIRPQGLKKKESQPQDNSQVDTDSNDTHSSSRSNTLMDSGFVT